jgi:hypothetical protein
LKLVSFTAFQKYLFCSCTALLQWGKLGKGFGFLFAVRQTEHNYVSVFYRGADKSLALPGRKQATATEDFDFHCFTVHFYSLYVFNIKILKLLKVLKYNVFMDDQYHWVVCLPFISFLCCLEWRGLLTVFRSG